MSMRIKKNDQVRVISGKSKGKEGKILRHIPAKDMVVVEGVNVVSRHVKPNKKTPQAGIIKQEAPIYAAKVMLICPQCGAATRVGSSFLESGKKVRVCRKCKEIIDKA